MGDTRIVHVRMFMRCKQYSCLHESLMNKMRCICPRALSIQIDFLWEEGNKFS